ncbi:MAG TPA: hypothetical protein VFM29_06990 [Vicinamibacteria bacterium]|nr:hypothetical protein [Vicinamibacteria bacterium]
MRRHLAAWARPLAGLLALLMGLTFSAPPAAAAEAAASARPVASKPTIADAAAKATRTVPRAALMQTTDAPAATETADSASGFFGTTRGKLALVLFAGGIGWTIYSAKNDRDPVKSPIR